MSTNEKIFVQIASYRDPELRTTIKDCLEMADQPENLVMSIVWQRSDEDEWDNLDEYLDDPRFRIAELKHTESKGACWARNLSQQSYVDEKYVMQIDSHHRFARGWDTLAKSMINHLQQKGYKKPLLSSYPPSYDPATYPEGISYDPSQIDFDRFNEDGIPGIGSHAITDWQNTLHEPVPTRSIAAGLIFTIGEWNKEVPYDPHLYFNGEEISLAVRSFTHGYDLFIPHRVLTWHNYGRRTAKRHWDDHKEWPSQNDASVKRIKEILGIDGMSLSEDIGPYGLGKVRTIEEYERYAGVRFRDRAIQQYTLDKKDAPVPPSATNEEWEAEFTYHFKHCLPLWKTQINDEEMLQYNALAIIFEDENDKEVYREDAFKPEILELIKNAKDMEHYMIWRTMPNATKLPYRWVIWPYNERYWGTKFEGLFNYRR